MISGMAYLGIQAYTYDPLNRLKSATETVDAITGMTRGGGNFLVGTANGMTQPGGPAGAVLGIPNPLEISSIPYDNARQASYGTAVVAGLTGSTIVAGGVVGAESSVSVVPEVAPSAPAAVVHGNSLSSLRPTWGYRLFQEDGTFLKNGITSQPVAEARYTRAFMADKKMQTFPFPNRLAARQWERLQNTVNPGTLNIRR